MLYIIYYTLYIIYILYYMYIIYYIYIYIYIVYYIYIYCIYNYSHNYLYLYIYVCVQCALLGAPSAIPTMWDQTSKHSLNIRDTSCLDSFAAKGPPQWHPPPRWTGQWIPGWPNSSVAFCLDGGTLERPWPGLDSAMTSKDESNRSVPGCLLVCISMIHYVDKHASVSLSLSLSLFITTYTYTYIYTYMLTYIYIYVRICISICISLCVCLCACVQLIGMVGHPQCCVCMPSSSCWVGPARKSQAAPKGASETTYGWFSGEDPSTTQVYRWGIYVSVCLCVVRWWGLTVWHLPLFRHLQWHASELWTIGVDGCKLNMSTYIEQCFGLRFRNSLERDDQAL